MKEIFADNSNFGSYYFPPVMYNAIQNPKISDFKMLSTHHSITQNSRNYMPGFEPQNGKNYKIEVLGPVVHEWNDKKVLKRISSNYGKTKNGHSVILRLHINNFKILFGGDLNIPAEKFLLKYYTGRERFPRKRTKDYKEMIKEGAQWFQSDVMKVCHHGSEKVTDAFMQTVNTAYFIISSGDQEGHVHPRPDLLGRLGKFGRGDRPVILSTELQRSTREKADHELLESIEKKIKNLNRAPTEYWKEKILEQIKPLSKTNVEVYGSIYVKTDGSRLIAAFKNESNSPKKKWFYFEYKIDSSGKLKLVD